MSVTPVAPGEPGRTPSRGPVRFGLLGAAWIAPRAIVEPCRDLSGAELAAVACRDPSRARDFAAAHGIPAAYASYEELLADDSLDAVFVALVNSAHVRWTVAALEAGRHVLCEKPLGANAAQAQAMVDAGRRSSRILVEAFHWRYHPLAKRVIELSRRIAPLRRAEAYAHQSVSEDNVRFRLDLAGGVLMDLGCYPVHWLRSITGEEPEVVSARAVEGPPGVDVSMLAELAFPCGINALVDCSMTDPGAGSPRSAWLRLEGECGELEVLGAIAAHSGNRITGRFADGTSIEESVGGATTYQHQLESFLAVVTGQAEPLTGGQDSIGNMATIDAIYRAAGLPLRG